MGKLKGIIQFTGTFNGLSFYEVNGKIVIRKTGGFDGEKIKKDPNYERVRENSSEFGHSAQVGKYFRDSIHIYIKALQIPYLHNHVVGLFHKILKFDSISVRGKRSVAEGIQTVAGKEAITNFEFDKKRAFNNCISNKYILDFNTYTLTLYNFDATSLKKPLGATGFSLQFFMISYDFETFSTPLFAKGIIHEFTVTSTSNSTLVMDCPEIKNGVIIAYLAMSYFQEVNGKQLPLQGGGIKIVGIQC